jgi:phage FluMu protein Com
MTDTIKKFKSLKWKSGTLAPADAKRPRCKVIESYNGKTGHETEDDTDLVDWLIVIAYETQE